MTGRIIGIAGPTVTVDLRGLKLYEMVSVGEAGLTGEVVRLERDRAVVQVYENTAGLAVGEPARGTARPLTVELGPGILSSLFDGLQRPLDRLRETTGPFISGGGGVSHLDPERRWRFSPAVGEGEEVAAGAILGRVAEGSFSHPITAPAAGRVASLDRGEFSLGEPLGTFADGREIRATSFWPVRRPRPCRRKLPPGESLVTGQRVIDFLFPLARGGTAIFPGGFGTGKTVLEQGIAKFADVDIVVYVGCGERGNETAELLEDFVSLSDVRTGASLMERTIVVVNTSNMPVAAREASIYTAVSMAEYYRDMGYHVLLLADSISRWAEALREISSSLEEMPGEEGYPTYLASRLAGFFERAGVVETLGGAIGSLSMVVSVSPPGGDFTEPVTQACLRAAGAFFMLDTSLAHRRHFPAVNWFQSYSLYGRGATEHFDRLLSPRWGEMQRRCRELLKREETLREVAEIVGVEGLQDADRLLMKTAERIRLEFLSQNAYTGDAFSPPEATLARIAEIVAAHDRAAARLAAGEFLDEVLKEPAKGVTP
ncbi:V-type ATP synthase subunit A [Geobacter sp.]|uniref:V-type ATP synthase subunit A n=1 Tax=Geobacter sp. TaxID=46610 RepID=UPI00260B0A58|nr:V-type ATP synthase subunit A [Geobacter sp.]